jgi:hypothetical protein
MKKEPDVNGILSQDVKLILTTATIVASVLGSFFTLKSDVQLLSQKLDAAVASNTSNQNSTQKTLGVLTKDDADLNARVFVLEAKTK